MSRVRAGDAGSVADQLWTVDDVAAYFKVAPRTIRDWRAMEATFPPPLELPGRSIRWHRDDVMEWARSLRGVA